MVNLKALFSIVIPTLNSQKDIAVAIQSVLDQSFTDLEILIIDAVSTDETLRIVEQFNDGRIRIFSEKDKGVYDAMNKGIGLAKGEWLYFLGSDDQIFDNNVLFDIQTLIKNEPAISVLYGDAIFKFSGVKHYGSTDLKRILYESNICHQAVFYHHSLFEKVGKYNLTYYLYADWDLNIRCFMHPDINTRYINRIISTYNELEGLSARNINSDMNFLDLLPAYQLNTQLHERNVQFDNQRKYFYNTIDYKLGKMILKPARTLKKILSRALRS